MASYLRSWFTSVPAAPPVPNIEEHEPESDDDADTITIKADDDDYDDTPPAFPALNSAQRAATSFPSQSNGPPRILSDKAAVLMPPPPVPVLARRIPGVPATTSSSLSIPLTPNTLTLPTSTTKRVKASKKVQLAPGHGALDWANLKNSGKDLRGVDTLMRIPPSVLKRHNKRDDIWMALYGKVYNVTAYMPYHPGGEKELMRVAGRDGTKLFAATHGWVNAEFMLDNCMVGFMVPEPEPDSD
ncbi:cytochrome b5 [Thelephora terrestris]|uniref:Cytochrome b5 n=1 Tax=Thelephora terrestris TaxID=56493 RepID=A0A9P6L951_9AGAM|nr:cytochrome b5 [Thelephora terrestris]